MHTHSLPSLLSALPHSLTASASDASRGMGHAWILFVVVLAVLGVAVLMLVSFWKLYEKAGKPGWTILVPFYNKVILLEMAGRPLWWIVLLFVPFVNFVILIYVYRRLALAFGKQSKWFVVGMIFLPFIFFPILGLGTSTYSNDFPPAGPMSPAVKWALIGAAACLMMETPFLMGSLLSNSSKHAEPLHSIGDDSGYVTDDTYVYYNDVLVQDADPETFTDISGTDGDTGYAKDSMQVYDDGVVIPQADPASFRPLGYPYSEDATHVFYYSDDSMEDSILEGADPATFTVVASDATSTYDAMDKNHKYLVGQIVTGS